MIPLPQWITGEVREAWDEYVALRIRDKKAMTPRSMVARVKRLQELKDAGHDPLRCLDAAINGHWLDFYVPREAPIEPAPVSRADAERAMQEAEQRRVDEYIRRTTQPIRRVS